VPLPAFYGMESLVRRPKALDAAWIFFHHKPSPHRTSLSYNDSGLVIIPPLQRAAFFVVTAMLPSLVSPGPIAGFR